MSGLMALKFFGERGEEEEREKFCRVALGYFGCLVCRSPSTSALLLLSWGRRDMHGCTYYTCELSSAAALELWKMFFESNLEVRWEDREGWFSRYCPMLPIGLWFEGGHDMACFCVACVAGWL